MAFTFSDYLEFAAIDGVEETTYASIAAGVLNYIKESYGIYTELTTINRLVYLQPGQTVFYPTVGPIDTVNTITYGSEDVEFTHTQYSDEVTLSTSVITSIRAPLLLNADVGYDITNVIDNLVMPDDLKVAIYGHISSTYLRITEGLDNLQKVINASGNTQYYRDTPIPFASTSIYTLYSFNIQPLYTTPNVDTDYRED